MTPENNNIASYSGTIHVQFYLQTCFQVVATHFSFGYCTHLCPQICQHKLATCTGMHTIGWNELEVRGRYPNKKCTQRMKSMYAENTGEIWSEKSIRKGCSWVCASKATGVIDMAARIDLARCWWHLFCSDWPNLWALNQLSPCTNLLTLGAHARGLLVRSRFMCLSVRETLYAPLMARSQFSENAVAFSI